MRQNKVRRRYMQHEPQLHKSVIMWRGEMFEFIEPIQEDDLLQFFATVKHRQGELPSCDIGEVCTFFHGAGDYPINNAILMCQSSREDNKIYYFPNNEMIKPLGRYDSMISKVVLYPSKDETEINGCRAGDTLYTLCKHVQKYRIVIW